MKKILGLFLVLSAVGCQNSTGKKTSSKQPRPEVELEIMKNNAGAFTVRAKEKLLRSYLCSTSAIDQISFDNYIFDGSGREYHLETSFSDDKIENVNKELNKNLRCKTDFSDNDIIKGVESLILNGDYESIQSMVDLMENEDSLRVLNLKDSMFNDYNILSELVDSYDLVDIDITSTPAQKEKLKIVTDRGCKKRTNSICGYQTDITGKNEFLPRSIKECYLKITENNEYRKCSHSQATEDLLNLNF